MSNPVDSGNAAYSRNCHSIGVGRVKGLISLGEKHVLKNEAEERFKNSDGVCFLGCGLIIRLKGPQQGFVKRSRGLRIQARGIAVPGRLIQSNQNSLILVVNFGNEPALIPADVEDCTFKNSLRAFYQRSDPPSDADGLCHPFR